MYNNIGEKIKLLAIVLCIVECVMAIFVGFILLAKLDMDDAWWCLFIIFFGPVFAYVSSWFMYGIGEAIQKLCEIEENTRPLAECNGENENFQAPNVQQNSYNNTYNNPNFKNVKYIYCPRCGTKHDSDYLHCPHCGHQYQL